MSGEFDEEGVTIPRETAFGWLGLSALRWLPGMRFFLVLMVACTTLACSGLDCRRAVTSVDDSILELAYFAESDAPTVTVLRIYESGVLELEPVGLRRRCARPPEETRRELLQLISSPSFVRRVEAEAEQGNDLGVHEAGIRLELRGLRFQRRPEIVSEELLRAIDRIESILREELPSSERFLAFSIREYLDPEAEQVLSRCRGPRAASVDGDRSAY